MVTPWFWTVRRSPRHNKLYNLLILCNLLEDSEPRELLQYESDAAVGPSKGPARGAWKGHPFILTGLPDSRLKELFVNGKFCWLGVCRSNSSCMSLSLAV